MGNTTVFSQISTTPNRRAAPYTMPEAGQLQSVSVYHEGGSGRMLLGVYADSSGKPGPRLGVTNATTVNSTQGWQTIALQSPVSVSAGQKIWLAWLFENNPGIRFTTGTPGRADAGVAWTGGMPTTFGTSSVANYIYSIYATYRTGSTATAAIASVSAMSDSDAQATAATTDQAPGKSKDGPGARRQLSADAADLGAIMDIEGSQAVDHADESLDRSALTTETKARATDRSVLAEQAGLHAGQPATARDAQGNIWAVWHAGAAGERQVYAARLAPQADTYGDTVQVSEGTGDHCEPAVAIDAAGTLYAVWQEKAHGPWTVCLSTSFDGRVWSAPQPIAGSNDNQTNPALAAGSSAGGLVAVAWQQDRAGNQDIYVAASTDAFATATVSQVTSDDADQTEPALAVGGTDTIFMLWTDARNGATDLYGAASNDGPWTNVPLTAGPSNQSQPALAAGSIGDVLYLAWVDDLGGNTDIFYAASAGLPAGPLAGTDIVDDASGADQRAPVIVVAGRPDGTDAVFVYWQDGRNARNGSTTDLYFADVSADAPVTNMPVGNEQAGGNQGNAALGGDCRGCPRVFPTDDGGTNPRVRHSALPDPPQEK